ncbi:MAG: GGDEF domain-containing protein [Nitriliruptorales bacterium]
MDTTVSLDDGGRELRRDDAAGLLGGLALDDVLDTASWDALLTAIRAAPQRSVELTTADGRVLDATVARCDDGALVVLRDVSQYASAAAPLAAMTLELGRVNRDLHALDDATATLAATLDVDALCEATCRVVVGYLSAAAAAIDVHGRMTAWPAAAPDGLQTEEIELTTARGALGTLRWWRASPVSSSERRLVELIASRAAISLDHALLLRAAEERAEHDALTGLLNRAGAQTVLAGFSRPFAIALVDLDEFKRVNDEHGHAEGDRVLRAVAGILGAGRTGDVKARWGGEEFLVALKGSDVDRTEFWVSRRLAAVRREVEVGGRPVTFSAGVSLVSGPGLEEALAAADAALYEAKAAGRNQVRVAQPGFA